MEYVGFELDFTGITGTMEELGVRKGGLVTTPSLPTRTDREVRVGCVKGDPGINTTPPPPGQTETAGRQSRRYARGTR